MQLKISDYSFPRLDAEADLSSAKAAYQTRSDRHNKPCQSLSLDGRLHAFRASAPRVSNSLFHLEVGACDPSSEACIMHLAFRNQHHQV